MTGSVIYRVLGFRGSKSPAETSRESRRHRTGEGHPGRPRAGSDRAVHVRDLRGVAQPWRIELGGPSGNRSYLRAAARLAQAVRHPRQAPPAVPAPRCGQSMRRRNTSQPSGSPSGGVSRSAALTAAEPASSASTSIACGAMRSVTSNRSVSLFVGRRRLRPVGGAGRSRQVAQSARRTRSHCRKRATR